MQNYGKLLKLANLLHHFLHNIYPKKYYVKMTLRSTLLEKIFVFLHF